ncbi:VOC family protein [Patescibacteria group bacterium]|nr:VOC family protein [Patescibacteria group bacterium]
MEFGHIGFSVNDLQKSKEFYRAALIPLGLSLTHESDEQVRFGKAGKTTLYIHTLMAPPTSFHIAFEVKSREEVDAFYAAALAAGGTDHGAPGIRQDYSPTYYAAFVLDPNGHNIEVVCR